MPYDVISGVQRPNVAEITSGLLSEHQKCFDNSIKARDGRGMSTEYRPKGTPGSANRMVILPSLSGATMAYFNFRSDLTSVKRAE